MPKIEEKLAAMGHRLPPPPEPVGNYLAASRSGNIMWMAGVGSRRDDGTRVSGKLGAGRTPAQGKEADGGGRETRHQPKGKEESAVETGIQRAPQPGAVPEGEMGHADDRAGKGEERQHGAERQTPAPAGPPR